MSRYYDYFEEREHTAREVTIYELFTCYQYLKEHDTLLYTRLIEMVRSYQLD